MVLAQIVKRRQFEQGKEEGIEQTQREHTEQLEAWAKEKAIPLDDLPKLGKPKSKRA